jgi:cell fate regulator YaaT (PSP1 superfamily)
MVVRSWRGTELGEMLTSTCPNSGCSKSVSRQDMLRYIENSGGRDYPFFTDGRVLRIATREDLDRQAQIEQGKHELRLRAREIVERLRLDAKVVEVEPILGGESVTVHYASEERIELRDLSRELSHLLKTRLDLHHVGARDEARLTADYEKCGQYCCCKNFLKVLSPVSMKSAKVQKATLDPLKISGRCGRLMCCLRYEDQTYEELRKRLPRRKSRVGTPEGDGFVVDGQILTQLVLVELDEIGSDGKIKQVAVPVENLTPPTSTVAPPRPMPGERPPETRPREGQRPARPAPITREQAPEPIADDRAESVLDDDAPDALATTGPAAPSSDRRDASPPRGPKPPREARRGPGGQGGQGGQGGPGTPPRQRPGGPQGGGPNGGPSNPPGTPRNAGPNTVSNTGLNMGLNTGPRSQPPRDASRGSRNAPPKSASDEIDDLLSDMETDLGHPGPGPSGPGSQGDGGRRRRRRGRGGGGGGGGGGPGNAPGPSGPAR